MMRVDAWFLASGTCDMRAGMDTLLARVVRVFGAAQPHVAYAFANARATRIKVLLNDGYGLWLCSRRLHSGCLAWPHHGGESVQLDARQWHALTVGLPWQWVDRAITQV